MLGQPLCRDCYDYASHVVWQWWAPELWRRFTIAPAPAGRQDPRRLGHPAGRGRHRPVRQGRRVPAPRRDPLPRPGPPRRPPHRRRVRARTPAIDAGTLGRAGHPGRRLGPADRARRRRRATRSGTLAFGAPARRPPGPHQPPHRRPRPDPVAGTGRRLPGQVRHQDRRRDTGATDNAHHRRLRATARRPGRPGDGHSRQHRETPTRCWASGCTCSASAATSPPSPAATPSPSARCAEPGAAPRP